MVSSLDFMPTFAEISGATLPDREFDGQSMTTLFETGKMERAKPLLWAFYNALNEEVIAMRTDDWKIMCRLKNDTAYLPKIMNVYNGNEALVKQAELTDFVLYNMKQDISEADNAAAKYPKVFEKMKEQLKSEYAGLLEDSFIWKRVTE